MMSRSLARLRHGLAAGGGLALLSAVLFGASTPLAKLLLGGVHPVLLAGLLYLGSGLGLLALQAWRAGSAAEAGLAGGDWRWLGAAILAGGIVAPVLLLWGLARTPAAAASLLLTLESVFTLSLAWILFAEPVDRRIGLGPPPSSPGRWSLLGKARSGPGRARPGLRPRRDRWRSPPPAWGGRSTTISPARCRCATRGRSR